MIEKIPDQLPVQTGEWRGTTFDIIPKETFGMACRKINELVDAVNGILAAQEQYATIYNEDIMPMLTPENSQSSKIAQGFKNLQDPYAEQRKWAGKLCWFWEDDPNDKIVDVLSHIDTARLCPFIQCDHQIGWTNCEPVKPDDDIIYKGGDNE